MLLSSPMFRTVKPNLKTFFVSSANWESIQESTSHSEAASLGLEEALSQEGKNLKLSPGIITLNATDFSLNSDMDHAKVFKTSEILANIGKHSLSKKIKGIIE